MAIGMPSNMQGDLFSRGFPKYNESYYFFSISKDQATEFTKKLAVLVKNEEISTLEKVLADWGLIESHKSTIFPLSNALIAFSMAGLEIIQKGLPNNKLQLDIVKNSDPAFAGGMKKDGTNLNDPEPKEWHPLFRSESIHGLLKVAGSSADQVETKLNRIKGLLGHPTVIADIEAQSLPASVNSRVDGQVREKFKGKEHFGFRDGISQPLLKGIDKTDAITNNPYMVTPRRAIIVGKESLPGGLTGGYVARPGWMLDGSFLVFRKFEQDVGKFQELTSEFKSASCISADQFGARLMGRWQSGAPYVRSPGSDPGFDPKGENSNEFTFASPKGCALAAHIRKTNPRDDGEVTPFKRIVRNGIPYGTDYADDKTGKRGLLFACYQSSIENGFQEIQTTWANKVKFPRDSHNDNEAGHDPFIGQPAKDEQFRTTLFDENNAIVTTKIGGLIPKLVTLQGGEYFFAPSISALLGELGSA
ncbi:MAG: hypothetical protein M1839_001349 [Geoglossum umbratile]|nr:MAG: hypothetical protein M1839_001349 [Geoglossum umbratile]